MNKYTLSSNEYKEFVRDHFFRPYQNRISKSEKPLAFSQKDYDLIPDYVARHPDWAEKVFRRISNIFKTIETGVFPSDLSAMVIMTECAKRGVVIEYT